MLNPYRKHKIMPWYFGALVVFCLNFSTSMQASFAEGIAPAAPRGQLLFNTYCGACHQPTGIGIPSVFPPLVGHVTDWLSREKGRDYLIRVVLGGIEGAMTVKGVNYAGAMPSWASLDDESIASILNYVSIAWGNQPSQPEKFELFKAQEIHPIREEKPTPQSTYALRQRLLAVDLKLQAVTNPVVIKLRPVSFTPQQVQEGREVYDHNCKDCHGSNLDNGEFGGAPLKGSYFKQHWEKGSVANLSAYMKTKMPPDRPGVFSDKVYADLVAFLLQSNGYEAGSVALPSQLSAQQGLSLEQD